MDLTAALAIFIDAPDPEATKDQAALDVRSGQFDSKCGSVCCYDHLARYGIRFMELAVISLK